jgi:hypothetical protein
METKLEIFSEGEKVYIRTVTHHQVGEVVGVSDVGNTTFVVLKNASWIADSGRWHDALKDGFKDNAEIEPEQGLVAVNVGSIIDINEWVHALPTKQQ